MNMNLALIYSWVVFCVFSAAWAQADVFGLWVPNELNGVIEGNSSSALPFNYLTNGGSYQGPVHYQQVYGASQFTNWPPSGGFITWIHLRTDCANIGSSRTTNLEVRLSTTARGVDQLSALFKENAGPDEILTFHATSFGFGSSGPNHCPRPEGNGSFQIELETPFFYNPSKGNLLVDVQHSGFKGEFSPAYADAQNAIGDGVSRVAALSLTALTAEFLDTQGLVTLFDFASTPSLSIHVQTNALEISWPYNPTQFVFQWAQRIDGSQNWQPYAGTIAASGVDGVFTKHVEIQLNSAFLKSSKFFRLFLNSPQPGIPGGATQALGSENSTPSN